MLTAGEINILIRARDQASRTLGRIGGAGARMGQAIRRASLVGVAGLAALGVAAFRFAGDFDDAANTLRRGTGATGEALEALKEDFRETFRGVPDSMADVATATADLNTRLGLTGPPLQAMTRQFLDLARVAEVDVATAIAAGTRVFGDWSIAVEDQSAALDRLFVVSQTTGIGVDALAQKVVQFGAPLRQFGFGFEEATALLGSWEREGVNAEAILGALKIGVANFARENIDAATGLQDFIDELNILGPGAEATARAIELFGSRAGPDMAAAVTEGRFALDDLMATLDSSTETIAGAAEATLTWKDKLGTLRNEMLVRVEPALTAMTAKAEEFSEWLAEEGAPKAEAFIRSLQPFVPVLEGIWRSFRTGLETIQPPLEALFNFVIDNKPVMVAALVAIGVAIVLAFGPVSVAIAAILGLIVVIGLVRDNWEMLRGETERILGIIGDVVDEKMGIIDEVIVGAITAIVGFVRENWNAISGIIEGALELIKLNIVDQLTFIRDIFRFAFAVFRGDWGGAWDLLKQIVTDRLEFMRQRIEIVMELIRDVFRLGWAAVQDVVVSALEGLRDVFVFALAAFVSFWTELPGRIIDALGDLGSLLFEAGRQLVQGLADGVIATWDAVKDTILDIIDPRNWNIPGLSPLFPAMAHAGEMAGEELMKGMAAGIDANAGLAAARIARIFGNIGSLGITRPEDLQNLMDLLNPNIPWPVNPGFPPDLITGEPISNVPRPPPQLGAGMAAPNITQHITVNVENRSPAAIAHAVEMAGLELGEQLVAEGV